MLTESMHSVVNPTLDECPRCLGQLAVAIPGSDDVERICVCRSCAAIITIDDYKINGLAGIESLDKFIPSA